MIKPSVDHQNFPVSFKIQPEFHQNFCLIELSRLLFCDPLFCCYPPVNAMSETFQTAFRWVDIRRWKFPFQSAAIPWDLTLLWPFPFQEYFYKSQESLATVIDFVEEKVDKKRTDGSEMKEEELEEPEESCNASTHSPPLFPASRKRPTNLDPRLRLTPWMTGLEVWSLLY